MKRNNIKNVLYMLMFVFAFFGGWYQDVDARGEATDLGLPYVTSSTTPGYWDKWCTWTKLQKVGCRCGGSAWVIENSGDCSRRNKPGIICKFHGYIYRDSCTGLAACDNNTVIKDYGIGWHDPVTTNKCHYIDKVNTWSTCRNGSQVAQNVHWTTVNGKTCTNVPLTKTCVTCGDGIIGPGEQCDDGAGNNKACSISENGSATCKYCSATCTLVESKIISTCGDGIIGPGEQCDDGANNNKPCSDSKDGIATCKYCNATCTRVESKTISCGTASSSVEVYQRPDGNSLCKSDPPGESEVSPSLMFDNGVWKWGCVHKIFKDLKANNCSALSCLNGSPFKIQSTVYFGADGQPSDANMTVTCQNVCCSVTGTRNNSKVTVCNGADGKIPVKAGSNEYPVNCWIDGDEDKIKDPGEENVDRKSVVSTVCVSKSCGTNGKCQGRQMIAGSSDQCESVCSSDADCSQSHFIETRP